MKNIRVDIIGKGFVSEEDKGAILHLLEELTKMLIQSGLDDNLLAIFIKFGNGEVIYSKSMKA